jgi:hypothetical protein
MSSTLEEKRVLFVVECTARRLGMYLEPAEDDQGNGRGATIKRFDPVGDAPGDVERSGAVQPGFRLDKVDDRSVLQEPFQDIVGLLVSGGRPIRLTFRDPSATDHRDAYGFLRTKLHSDRAMAYFAESSKEAERNDFAWRDFLAELGGKQSTSFGVQRLLRDAAGEVTLCEEPSVRLNAVSPQHGHMTSLSSPAAAAAAAAAAAEAQPSAGAHAVAAGPSAAAPEAAAAAASAAPPAPLPLQVIGIHKRCWAPTSIGVCVPPGLQQSLPGRMPPARTAERARERLRALVLQGGVPAAFRPAIWWELSGAHAKAAQHPPYYYTRLQAHAPAPDVVSAIGKDIDRTFPGHTLFESLRGQAALRRILSAFALHNPEVGYCQSLNFLAGFLLMLMGEEQAFWCLDVLCNELLPMDYYSHTLLGVQADQRVLAHLVSVLLPEVHRAYDACGIELSLVTVGAFARARVCVQ